MWIWGGGEFYELVVQLRFELGPTYSVIRDGP